MKKPKIYSCYEPCHTTKLEQGELITEQNTKDDADINLVLQRYDRDGVITHTSTRKGTYDDIPSIDFQQAQEIIANANSMFEQFPAHVRAEFDNSPEKFLKAAEDPSKKDLFVELGLSKGLDNKRADGTVITPEEAPQAVSEAPAVPQTEAPAELK